MLLPWNACTLQILSSQEAERIAAVRVQPQCSRPAHTWHTTPLQAECQPTPDWARICRPGSLSDKRHHVHGNSDSARPPHDLPYCRQQSAEWLHTDIHFICQQCKLSWLVHGWPEHSV